MSASTDVPNDLKAHVFLSCGQEPGEEEETAKKIGTILGERGYEVYIARQQVSLEGLKEAIFPQLRDADYLLFIDFPRDVLRRSRLNVGPFSQVDCRGSLFSHQELAIASFLEIPYIGFRHKSVLREGLSQFLLSNVREFDDSTQLPRMLGEELELREQRDWNAQSRRQLRVSRPDPEEGDDMITDGRRCRFFHLTVDNLHRAMIARGCMAYVDSITDARTNEAIDFKPAELKWAGTPLPAVPIRPQRPRDLDACLIFDAAPDTIFFASTSDSGKYMAPIKGHSIEVTYSVLSENLRPAGCSLRIEPGSTPQQARVYLVNEGNPSEKPG
jgi:hypothetical protein